MSAGDNNATLDGTLVSTAFTQSDPVATVGPLYRDLLDDYAPTEILILKRFPTGIETFTDRLAGAVSGVARPRVLSLNRHAAQTLTELDDPPRTLSDIERIELVEQFLVARDWETPFLRQAASQASFRRDLGRLMLIIAWQGGLVDDPTDPVLAEIAETADTFREELDAHGYLERGRTVATAAEALRKPAVRERVQADFEAVLAIEFEEFAPLDREYVRRLSMDHELVAVAEQHSSIQRTWNEAETIERLIEPASHTSPDPPDTDPSRPNAVAQYLATGTSPTAVSGGSVQVIAEQTFEEQVRTVADEIQRLREAHGWSYDEFAVGFKDSSAPLNDTIRLLRQAGIPTASATVTGFSDDPAVRELYTLAQHLADPDRTPPSEVVDGVPNADAEVLTTVETADGVEAALWAWIDETALKDRIASETDPLEARAQFDHIQDVLSIAAFIEDTPMVVASWPEFVRALERMFEYTSPDTHTSEVDVKDDGVLVDAVRVMKNASWNAVFMLNVVEGTYPAVPELTRLFPTARLQQLPAFPGVTTPTATDVTTTFDTAPADSDRPFERYYTELSRRLLAVGSRAATDRLYFGVYDREDPTTGKRTQPSRFLAAVYDRFSWVETLSHDTIHGESGATRFALDRVDRLLTQVHRAALADEPVDLDAAERDLGAIQEFLADGDEHATALRRAVQARVDFAEGRVRRE